LVFISLDWRGIQPGYHSSSNLSTDKLNVSEATIQLEEKTGFCIYFADLYLAWQHGSRENTNGLLRQYFTKGMNFRKITDKVLALAVKKINHRPKKYLNYQTPYEV